MLFFNEDLPEQSELEQAITSAYRMDEAQCVTHLIQQLQFTPEIDQHITAIAATLVSNVRKIEEKKSGIEALMMHYDLSTEEGIMLMCIAEALLRIPDKETEDLLINDKLTSADWQQHIGASESSFVNMATWGLALTGKVLEPKQNQGYFSSMWKKIIKRSGEPVIRQAVREAIKVMSHQFVIGRNIDEALKRSESLIKKGYTFSYDMLGEVARTQNDADKYFAAYERAIKAIGSKSKDQDLIAGPSISIKLSALYPRYEFIQREKAIAILTEKLHILVKLAKEQNISVTVDAEEADRLEMSLNIIENVFSHTDFSGWEGLGLAVQAYQKRAYFLINWLIKLAQTHNKRMQVRLVKGAYWDSEIKVSQVGGFVDYPVFTRKSSTDVSYLACAKLLLSAQDAIYPQFATHNAYSVAAILTMMDDPKKYDFEFQNLQGMGKSLHDQIVLENKMNLRCRIYAPVGSHEDLLPYLVRRLLENGANSSFVNQISDPKVPIESLIENPILVTESYESIANNKIVLPKAIYGAARDNSLGFDFSQVNELKALEAIMVAKMQNTWTAGPFNQFNQKASAKNILSPIDGEVVGQVQDTTTLEIPLALDKAQKSFKTWDDLGPIKRAAIIAKVGDLIEQNYPELMAIAVREAGKNMPDAVAEVREATDFCRYYAQQAVKVMWPQAMPGPTGETNTLRLKGRGVIVCISPWNFPIAIFTGQIAAALVTGNTVIAKPAEQTPLVAAKMVELFYEAGVPKEVLQLLPGPGETVGAALVEDLRIAGVIFTGSTQTAKLIQKTLANKPGPIVPFIAETGGMNAMLVDSTALPEQCVADVIQSAFGSAGQRCSALRILFIQDDVADRIITMLKGAMAEINVGDPMKLSTDVGPVIDKEAKAMLDKHIAMMKQQANTLYEVKMPESTQAGTYVAPIAFELSQANLLTCEVFGPVLHVVRFKRDNLDDIINSINNYGYGLTFGIQSRIDDTVDYIQSRIIAGNIYVNRNMIGAVVGVQPFGGSHLSGTGPKAGGPHYLLRLCDESTLTINTTAAGGNASLMAMSD